MQLGGALFHGSMHMDAEELEPASPTCIFCNGTDRVFQGELQSNPSVTLLKCLTCHLVSASRFPTSAALTRYYDHYYQQASDSHAPEITVDDPRYFGAHIANYYAPFANGDTMAILDFGGGDGSIAYATAQWLLKHKKAQTIHITVVDPSFATLASGQPGITIEKKATLEEVARSYQLVLASAILEHLPDPKLALDKLLQAIVPGGIFYARTPVMVPLKRALAHIKLPLDFTYPGHLHDMGQAFWEHYFSHIPTAHLLHSRPSRVETNLRNHLLRTLAAYALKAPWHFLGSAYQLVGGWEVLAQKNPAPANV